MKVLLAALVLMSVQVQAQNLNSIPTQFPNESGWALAMISMACKADIAQVAGVVGTIEPSQSGVVYKATVGNKVVLAANATSTSIFAKKSCVR